MDPKELRLQAGQLVTEARAIMDLAQAEKRSLTPEESEKVDRLHEEAEAKISDAERLERGEALRSRTEPASDDEERRSRPGQPGGELPAEERAGGAAVESRALMIGGVDYRGHARATDSYNTAFRAWLQNGVDGVRELPAEVRAGVQADLFAAGGALAPPMQFVAGLIKFVDDAVVIRQSANIQTVTMAQALGVPSFESDPADPEWTSELLTGDDGEITVGRRELYPHPLAKGIKVSRKITRMVPRVDQLVQQRLGYKFQVALEKGYLTGTGVQQPLGIFTASADGIPTSRDVSTDMTATDITADGLIEAKHALKQQYWNRPGTRWIFHRDFMKRARKLKDGDGRYIWQPALTGGLPGSILEIPYLLSEYAPNTFTGNSYVAVVGDFGFYWIADALTLQVDRLMELYARTNQIGFVGRFESDGQPVLAEAFVRCKLAAP